MSEAKRKEEKQAEKKGEVKKQKKRKGRIAVFVISAPVGLLLLVYCSIALYYQTHFFPNTKINGINCSNINADKAAGLLEGQRQNYVLEVTGRELQISQEDNEISENQGGGEGRRPQQPGQRDAGIVEPGGAHAGEQGAHKDEGPRHGGPGEEPARKGAGQPELPLPGLGECVHRVTCHKIPPPLDSSGPFTGIVPEGRGEDKPPPRQSFFVFLVSKPSKRCIICGAEPLRFPASERNGNP